MRPGCGSGRGAECFWADDSGVFTGHQLPTPVAWGLGPCCCSPPHHQGLGSELPPYRGGGMGDSGHQPAHCWLLCCLGNPLFTPPWDTPPPLNH